MPPRFSILPVTLAALAAPAMAQLSLNLPQALADTKARLAASQTANIVVFGDSLSLREGSYLPYFRYWMQQHYGDAGAGYQAFSLWTGAAFDLLWTLGQINSDTPPRYSLDGLWAASSASPWPPTFTTGNFTAWNRTVSLQYAAKPGGGSFTIAAEAFGNVIATIDTDAPAQEVRTFSYTYSGNLFRMWFQPQGDGEIVILGQNNTRPEAGVRIHRAANGGWGVGNFLARNWTFDQQLPMLSPDLCLIWLGQNDAASYSRASYKNAIGQMCDRIQAAAPGAEIVLIGTYDSGIPQLADLVGGMADLAAQRGYGFINIYQAAGPRQFFDDNDYLDDGVHFSYPGGRYVGRVLYNAFISDGATLSIPPTPYCVGDTNLDNATDSADLSVLLSRFGTIVPAWTSGDLNGDNRADAADLSVMLANWGCMGP